MRTSIRSAVLLLPVLLAAPARPDDLQDTARRIAGSFARQIAAKLPGSPAVAVSPLKEHGKGAEGAGRAFGEALEAALGERKVAVVDWAALDQALREQLLAASIREGQPARPSLGAVQAIVSGEVVAGADPSAPLRVTLRLVAVATGSVLVAEAGAFTPRRAARSDGDAASAGGGATPASVDVAMRKVADALASGFQKLPGSARYQRLAVLEFSENGAEAKRHELGAIVSAELATNLRRDHGLLLVERSKLKQILGELHLGAIGLTDPSLAPKLGRLADAQALVMGSVAEAGDRYLIHARIVATESAETLAAASEPVSAGTLVALSTDSVVLRSRKDGAFRSLLLPGWGQFYNREPLKGTVVLGTEAALLAAAGVFHALGAKAESDYRDAPAATAGSLRRDAERDYRWRNGLLAAAGALWVLNVADAYFSGVDGDRVVAGLAVGPGEGRVVLAGRF